MCCKRIEIAENSRNKLDLAKVSLQKLRLTDKQKYKKVTVYDKIAKKS